MNFTLNSINIGVIGIGDLGAKLITQLLISGKNVVAFDISPERSQIVSLDKAIDPSANINLKAQLKIVSKVSDVMEACELVHWALPSDWLTSLQTVNDNNVVILHDSVMVNSKVAISKRSDSNNFVFAHCLMNDALRVFISPEQGEFKLVSDHFKDVSLVPKYIETKVQDTMMARTQGVFALLIEFGIGKELDARFKVGDLTPSAIELRAALKHRESNWTQTTLDSIIRNPELNSLVNNISKRIAGG